MSNVREKISKMEDDVAMNRGDVMTNGEVVRLVLLYFCALSFIANERDGTKSHSQTLIDWF